MSAYDWNWAERASRWAIATVENQQILTGPVYDSHKVDARMVTVRFMKVAGGEADPNDLLDRVKTEVELSEVGAELYMDSVIHGDVAYDVQPGFIGAAEPK